MTKAEAIEKLKHLKIKAETNCFDQECDELIEYVQSQPEITHCKECIKRTPMKYCTYWECTMYDNAYCDQGERKNGRKQKVSV